MFSRFKRNKKTKATEKGKDIDETGVPIPPGKQNVLGNKATKAQKSVKATKAKAKPKVKKEKNTKNTKAKNGNKKSKGSKGAKSPSVNNTENARSKLKKGKKKKYKKIPRVKQPRKEGNVERVKNIYYPGNVNFMYTTPKEEWIPCLGKSPADVDFGNTARILKDLTDE